MNHIGINLSLSATDPLGKFLSLSGGGFFRKIGKKVDEILKGKVLEILNDSEVKKTLERIRKGERKYSQDGTVFKNKEGFLPLKQEGYYTEWTVETPGLSYRGEKRIVVGKGGEMYYTENYYHTFIRIK